MSLFSFHRRLRTLTALFAALTILLIAGAASAQAAPRRDDILNLESPPIVIEVGGPGLGDYKTTKTYTRKVNLRKGQTGYLDYSVEGPLPATLSVEVVDLGVDAGGNKIPVPLNSTKFGLRNTLKIELDKYTYKPNGTKQKYRVKITSLVNTLEGVRLGGVKVNLIPSTNAKAGTKSINIVSAIVVSVGAVQYGFDITEFNAQAKIKASDLRFVPVHRSGILGLIDYIPDIPRVIDHGPADWSLSILNIGIQPVEQFMRWRIVRGTATPYRDDVKRYQYLYAFEASTHLTIPGQKFTERTRTVLLKNTEEQSALRSYAKPTEVSALPFFGIITADAQVHTSFGAFTGATQHFSRTYLIFPWKEVLLIVLTYLGYRRARRMIKKVRKDRAERKLAEAETDAIDAIASLSPEQPIRAKRSITKKAAAKKSAAKKTAKKTPVKRVAKKAPAKKAAAKKTTKKAPAKKSAAKKSVKR
ncbi:hypothetical protein MCEPAE42_00403 [Candidatus Nanopelagicaceae bacterium]